MLAQLTAGIFFVLLIWGNLVAGMHAGMACPDWPLCKGNLVPPLALDVWMEYLHRVLAALSTVFLLMLARARFSSYQGWHKAIPIASLLLIAAEIMLGALVVFLGLPVQPTTVHFMIGLAIFLLVLFMANCDGVARPAHFSLAGYAGALFCLLLLVYSQASLGAYLRHSAAGLACPDFPTCRGDLIPAFWDGPTLIHFSHRLLGLGTLCSALLLFIVSLLDRSMQVARIDLLALVLLIVVQIGVGAATVKSGLSYPVTSLHLALTLAIAAFSMRSWLKQAASAASPR